MWERGNEWKRVAIRKPWAGFLDKMEEEAEWEGDTVSF